MEKTEIILLVGIIIALIWLGACIVIEGRNRKYVIVTGIIIDAVLFIVCRSWGMLFFGVIGGLLCGLVPGFGSSLRKYETAVRELKGVRNWVAVSVIFFVMIFMTAAIAYPGTKIVLR